MQTIQETSLAKHISFEYSSFDRVVLRGYIQGLFVEGSVIKLLRNLGFAHHSNGVLCILTDKLNSHIKKVAENLGVPMHWWGEDEKNRYHSKIDFIRHSKIQVRSIRTKKICCTHCGKSRKLKP